MKTVTLRNAQDVYAHRKQPARNFHKTARMYLNDGNLGYVFFANPVPARARVVSAKLRLFNGTAWAGSTTMSIARITEKWSVSKVTWNNRPAATGNLSVTKSNAPLRSMWEFDVSHVLQDVSDGGKWYGFRITVNGAAAKWIHSTQSARPNMRPTLEITWSENPFAPSDLSPDQGLAVAVTLPVLRWDFYDVAGDKTMDAFHLQVSTNSAFTDIVYDSGWTLSSTPTLDLSTTSMPAVADGQTRYWRVRVRDGAGLVSGWSHVASWKRLPKPALTIVSPAHNGVIEDSSPRVAWDAPAQVQYRVFLYDDETNKNIWDTYNVVSSTVDAIEIPPGYIKVPGRKYRVYVRVWDNEEREATPGDPIYTQAMATATFTPSATVAPTTNLELGRPSDGPGVVLEWESATMPDAFVVYRDGRVLYRLQEPEEYLVDGSTTKYRFIDRKVPGRKTHSWFVARVLNGKQSSGNSIQTLNVRNTAPWLIRPDGTDGIMLLDPAVDPGLSEDSEVLYPQDGPPMLVTQSLWGYVGTASGILANDTVSGLTAEQMKTRFLSMRETVGQSLYFVWSDEAIECYIYNTKITQINRPDGSTEYEVSFGFIQVDY